MRGHCNVTQCVAHLDGLQAPLAPRVAGVVVVAVGVAIVLVVVIAVTIATLNNTGTITISTIISTIIIVTYTIGSHGSVGDKAPIVAICPGGRATTTGSITTIPCSIITIPCSIITIRGCIIIGIINRRTTAVTTSTAAAPASPIPHRATPTIAIGRIAHRCSHRCRPWRRSRCRPCAGRLR